MRKTFRARQWLAALLSLALVVSLAPAAAAAGLTVTANRTGPLKIGETLNLTALKGDNTPPKSITWTSSNENVVTVDVNGIVTPVAEGQATITATAGTGSSQLTGTYQVTVVGPTVQIMSNGSPLGEIGDTQTLKAIIKDGPSGTISWEWRTNAPKVVAFDNGSASSTDDEPKIYAIRGGNATITAIAKSGGNEVARGEYSVRVKELTVTLDMSNIDLKISQHKDVTATLSYVNDAIKTGVQWTCTGRAVNDGVVTAVQIGVNDESCQFRITAVKQVTLPPEISFTYRYTNPAKSSESIEVSAGGKVSVDYAKATISDENISLTVGEKATLEAYIDKDNMQNETWAWTSNNPSLVDVVQGTNGTATITALSEGRATITATYQGYLGPDGQPLTAQCTVNVTPFVVPQVTITADPTGDIKEGEKVTLKASLSRDMPGTWLWSVVHGNSVISFTNPGDTDTCTITAAPFNTAVLDHDVVIKAEYTLDSTVTLPAGVTDKYSREYTFAVKEADYALELNKSSMDFNLLQPSTETITATLMKGGNAKSGVLLEFDTELKDTEGRTIAEVATTDPTTNTDGRVLLTVTPVTTGTADLEVRYKYGGASTGGIGQTVSQQCKINVTGPSIKVDPATLEMNTYELNTAEIRATLTGAGTVNTRNIHWSVANDKIVRITSDQGGLCRIEAIKNGTTTITAEYTLTGEVSGSISATCTVTVGTYSLNIEKDKKIVTGETLTVESGQTVDLSAVVKKIEAGDVTVPNQEKNLRWQISDGTIARFDTPTGVLEKAKVSKVKVVGITGKAGTIQVTVTWTPSRPGTYESMEKIVNINFLAPEAESFSFTLPRSTVSGKTGGDLTQTPTTGAIKWNTGKTYPVPGDFKPTYTYQSSDTTVAKVEQGKVVGVGAGEATITVSGSATANGKAITAEPKTYKVVVSADLSVKSIKLSATSLSLDVGGRQTVTATTDPAGAVVVWSSSDEKVATVNAGTIVAVGPGSATITAAAGGQTAQVQVTVNGLEQLLDEITVTEGKTVSVDTIFKAHGTAAGKNPTYSSLDPTVASYANGSIVGNKVGNTSITIASGSYRISVKVTVVADSTSIIDLPTLYTQSQPVLRFRDFIARFRPQAGGNLSHIVGLNLDTSKGTLYYNYTSANEPGAGVGADSYYLSPAAGQRGIEDITFVPKAGYSGRVTINYTAVSTGGQNFVCSIVFDVDPGTGTGSGLNLSTPYNTPLRFSGAEFNRVCQDRLGVRLDYVTFSQPSGQQGTLYTNYVSAGNYGKVVSGNDQYTTKALDDVWFVPAPGFSGSVTVYYTAYGVGGASYSGQASIAVGWENNVAIGGLTYDINRGGVAYFDDFRFSSYCRQVLDSSKNLSHIRFSSLPASNEGVLYYNYNSSSRTQASTGTNYYYNSSSPYIDRLAFAAASGFTGTVKIPFTGWTTDGVSFTGNVEVNVQGGGTEGSAGDILYICGAGQTVSFDDSDFNALSRTRTGSSLNYITLESLPGSASGSVYYNNSRASTGTNYRNGSSTPRIDNLSFRASSSFYGAVDIPFTGRATNGDTFRGVITVASSSSAVGSGSGNASQTVFTDMAGYSAAQQAAVNYLYDHNITRGMTTTQYGPQSSIRRGDFARMVYLAFDLTPSASSRPFQDVPSTAYYAQAVNALYSRGIVSGIGGGLYDPNGTLTRQDAICIVQRAMRAVGWSADDGSVSSLYRYSDGGSVSGYAQGAMAFAVERGILPTGGSWLNPTQPLSRVDMAEVLYRVLANSGY